MGKVRFFSPKNAEKVLGTPISDTEMDRICKRLEIDRKGKVIDDKEDKSTVVHSQRKKS